VNFDISILDNGAGILPVNFENLGTRFYSTKNNLDSCGKIKNRGEFLASLKLISNLSIYTKLNSEIYQISVLKDKNIILLVNNFTEIPYKTGTLIKIANVLEQFPVRRKHLLSNIKEIQKIIYEAREAIQYLILPYNNITIIIRDLINQKIILTAQPSKSLYSRYIHMTTNEPIKLALIPIIFNSEKLKIDGLIINPLKESKNEGLIICYINSEICNCEFNTKLTLEIQRIYSEIYQKLYFSYVLHIKI